jgi:hypothetical protein
MKGLDTIVNSISLFLDETFYWNFSAGAMAYDLVFDRSLVRSMHRDLL